MVFGAARVYAFTVPGPKWKSWLDWPSLKKTLYLLDTFAGPAIDQYSDDERNEGKLEQVTELLRKGAYEMDVRSVRANFAE